MYKGVKYAIKKAQASREAELAQFIAGYYKRDIEFQATANGCNPQELADRIGTILSGMGSQWPQGKVSTMRSVTAGMDGVYQPEMEVVKRASGAETPRRKYTPRKKGVASNNKTVSKHPLKGRRQAWWWKLPLKKRQEISAKRVASTKAKRTSKGAALNEKAKAS